MGARELGAPLGNPLGRAKASDSANSSQILDVFTAHVNTGTTQVFNIPFTPSNPAQLNIEFVNFLPLSAGGYGNSRIHVIPSPDSSINTSYYWYVNFVAGSGGHLVYDPSVNTISITADTSGSVQGALIVSLVKRTVKKYVYINNANAATPMDIGFTISDPGKTYINAVMYNGNGGLLMSYLSVSDAYSWHCRNYNGSANGVKIVSSSQYVTQTTGSNISVSIIEFE